MPTTLRDRDALVACTVMVGAGLALFAVGAVLDGFDLLHRLARR